ncbi:response regulator [Flavobacterium sp.]|uniref:response regulator n=1 Tax=Flavobacterium sp. TaxID=239 RepID=UPI0038FCBDB8
METEKIKKRVLIVDDHPFILIGYKNTLNRYIPSKFEFQYEEAKDCKSAYEVIMNPETSNLDFAFLDISMPAYPEKGILSGEDLAIVLHQRMPECKIIILTMFTEILKIKNIITAINPHGLVIKNDLDFKELIFGFDKIVNNEIYYSESIQKMIDLENIEIPEIDVIDKQILFHISKGTEPEDFIKYIPLSAESIEIRRKKLKKILIDEGTDHEMIKRAKSMGLLF